MFHAPASETTQQRDSDHTELQPAYAPMRAQQQLARLHSTYGNQAVLRMLSQSAPAIQTKLKVNEPGDVFEQEADRVADQVMRMPAPKMQNEEEQGADRYSPQTCVRQKLMAHELIHVLQQQSGCSQRRKLNIAQGFAADGVSSEVTSVTPRVLVSQASGVRVARTTAVQRAAIEARLLQQLTTSRAAIQIGGVRTFGTTVTNCVMILTTSDGVIIGSGQGRNNPSAPHPRNAPRPPHAEIAAYRDLMTNVEPRLQQQRLELFVLTDAPACPGCQQELGFGTPEDWHVRVYHPESDQTRPQILRLSQEILEERRAAEVTGQPESERQQRSNRIEGMERQQRGIVRQASTASATPTLEVERQARLPETRGSPPGRGGTPSSPVTPPTRGGSSGPAEGGSAARPVVGATAETARAAADSVMSDFRILRAARALTAALQVIDFISALNMIDEFIRMAQSGLAGRGFILTNEIQQAETLADRAANLHESYVPFSDSLGSSTLDLFRASGDPLSAGQAARSAADLRSDLQTTQRDLAVQISRVEQALREVRLKATAANQILESLSASAAIAIATFGTAEQATLVAASEDLNRVGGLLETTRASLQQVNAMLQVDIQTLQSWGDSLFRICERAGICTTRILNIPFTGEFPIRSYPGGP